MRVPVEGGVVLVHGLQNQIRVHLILLVLDYHLWRSFWFEDIELLVYGRPGPEDIEDCQKKTVSLLFFVLSFFLLEKYFLHSSAKSKGGRNAENTCKETQARQDHLSFQI